MLKLFYFIFLIAFSLSIISYGVNYSLSTQNNQNDSSNKPLVYLSSDKKNYAVGEQIHLITIVYPNSNNNKNDTVPLKINIFKTHEEMLWWFELRGGNKTELIDSFFINPKADGKRSIYNISTIESGRYKVTANTANESNTTNPLSFTQFNVKSIFFTLPALLIYVSIGFFIVLVLVIFFGQKTAYSVFNVDENKKTGEKNEKDQIVFIEIMRFVCLTGIASSFMLTLLFSEVEIGTNSPVGLVKKDVLKNINGTNIETGGEWVVNIGGGKEDNYSSGIQIPATVIIFGVAGGYLRYLYGLRYLYFTKKDGTQNSDSVNRNWGDIDISDELSLFKHSLRSLALFFLSPLLAVAVWFILFQGGTTGKHAIAALSFTVGLVTEEAIQAIIVFARNILGGLKGAPQAIETKPVLIEDTKSPKITNKIPSDKSTAVALKPEITVTFSEPIDKSSLSNSTFYLLDKDNNQIEGDISLNNDGITAKFIPKQELTKLSRYVVVITNEIGDIAGNKLNAVYKWSFTTQ
ncbi:MAG TPA: Ig-like domain-containing protein [Nitrososphaeraceae archaeon]|nr:Ig-like domain-containing protein [Nitrososphaeraceae archaeon]